MIFALVKEIELVKNDSFFSGLHSEVETIYFGGGTPSLLRDEEIRLLLSVINKNYKVAKNAEITLEANPDDINEEKLMHWKKAGINRLSIGIQSFKNEDLVWMNRVHNAEQALLCIDQIRHSGYENFSIDLIYGSPLLNDNDWQNNVERIINLKVPHISCYALTVEPKTVLYKMIEQKKKADIDPEKQAKHFLSLIEWMKAAGYEHYEISNFALPGYRSRHNSAYWQGKPYVGIGPSAHSFNGFSRRWNVSDNALYIQSLLQNTIPFQEENLSSIQHLNEYIMTSLRTIEGMNLELINKKFGEMYAKKILTNAGRHVANSNLINEDFFLKLTDAGKLFADGIAADLFFNKETFITK